MARMKTPAPARKVTASMLGSALAMLIIWALGEFTAKQPPEGIREALILLATFGFGYLVPPAKRDEIVTDEAG